MFGCIGRPRRRRRPIALATLSILPLFFALALAAAPRYLDTQPPTASMSLKRSGHTATLLPDGRVLVAGGHSSITTAEIYDPARNEWSDAGNMSIPRSDHTATLLPDGRVLVMGGSFFPVKPTELYDPATNNWEMAEEPRIARSFQTTTLLTDGTVLVAGGANQSPLTTAELYIPAADDWQDTGNMSMLRSRHTATLLPDGQVLVAGGTTASLQAERYDPASRTWHSAGTMQSQHSEHTATLLATGRVLVVGGFPYYGGPYPVPGRPPYTVTELLDPATNEWAAGPSLNVPRWGHTATRLPDGRVLVAGGFSWYGRIENSVEIYDPARGRWFFARPLSSPRSSHTATLLADGTVLMAGGFDSSDQLDTAERYDPNVPLLDIQRYLPRISRLFPTATPRPIFATPTPPILATAAPIPTEEGQAVRREP